MDKEGPQPWLDKQYSFLDPNFLKAQSINLPMQCVYELQPEKTAPPPQIREQINAISEFLTKNIKYWEVEAETKYEFTLPPTKFQGLKSCVEFREQKFEVEKLSVAQLSAQQLGQIWSTGTFVVKSQKFAYPYTWKLTSIIFTGRENIRKAFRWHIAQSLGHLLDIFRFVHNPNFKEDAQYCSIFRGVKNSLKISMKLFGLLLGKPCYKKLLIPYELEMYRRKLLLAAADKLGAQPLNDFISIQDPKNNPVQILYELQGHLSDKGKQAELSVREKFDKFEKVSAEVKDNIRVLMDCQQFMKAKNEEIKEKLHFCPKQQRAAFQEKPPFFQACFGCASKKQQVQEYSISQDVYYRDIKVPQGSKSYMEGIKKRQDIEKQFERQHPLRQLFESFKTKKLAELFDKEWEFFEKLRDSQILEGLKSKNYITQHNYFN